MILLNEAYNFLMEKNVSNDSSSMNFDFDVNFKTYFHMDVSSAFDEEYFELQTLWRTCCDLIDEKKYGLSIRLFEIGIQRCLSGIYNNYQYRLYQLGRDLGELLFRLGLINDGVKFFHTVEAYYYMGNGYFAYGDYKNAIKYWKYEFTNPKTSIDYEGLNLKIVKALFLLEDYQGCIDLIENLDKSIIFIQKHYGSSNFPRMLILAVFYIEEKKYISKNDFMLKYPNTYKYILITSGNYQSSINDINSIITDEKKYLRFYRNIKIYTPNFFIKGEISLDYSIAELKYIYEKIFKEPFMCNLLT